MKRLISGSDGNQQSTATSLTAKLQQLDQRPYEERNQKGLPLEVIRELAAHFEIPLPVRFEHAEVPDDPKLAKPVEKRAPGVWPIESTEKPGSRGGKPHKRAKVVVQFVVERGAGSWRCSCLAWRKNRARDCKHIKLVKNREGLEKEPQSLARRRPPTIFVYPEDEWVESTRRAHARAEWSTRVLELLEQLIVLDVVEPVRIPREDGRSLGPIGMPLRVATWSILLKVLKDLYFDELRAEFENDKPALWRLGWKKVTPPGLVTIIKNVANQRIVESLQAMVRRTAWMGRFYESEVMIDSEELPTVQVANSRDRKAKVKPANYRRRREMVVRHYVMGVITFLVASADITLDSGLGSADGAHLGRLLRLAKKIFPLIRAISADGAYGTKANFRKCAEMAVELYAYSLQNENREDPRNGWNELAQRMARLERECPKAFHEVRRKRNKGEGSGSRWKRVNPQARLRARRKDPKVEYPPEAAHLLHESLSEDQEQRRAEKRVQGQRLSELPDDVLDEVLDAASMAVGLARLVEAWATIVVGNVKMIVTFEHLCGVGNAPYRVDLEHDGALPVIQTVKESELRARLLLQSRGQVGA